MSCECTGNQSELISKPEQERLLSQGHFEHLHTVKTQRLWKVGHVIEVLSTYGCVQRWMLTGLNRERTVGNQPDITAMDVYGGEFRLFNEPGDHYAIGWRWGQDPKVLYSVYEMDVVLVHVEGQKYVGEEIIGYLKYADYNPPRHGQGVMDWTSPSKNYRIVYIDKPVRGTPQAMARFDESKDAFLPHRRNLRKRQ